MFDTLVNASGQWAWVALAWAQLLITYGGYQLYLRWRTKKVQHRSRASLGEQP